MSFTFKGDSVGISMRGTPDTKQFIWKHVGEADFIRNHPKLCVPVTRGLNKALDALEKEMLFKSK
jgi:hypothetical protein